MVVLFTIYQTLLRILIKISCVFFCLLFQYELPSQINPVRVVSAVQLQFEVFSFLFHRRLEPKDDGPLRISYVANVYSKKKKLNCKLISQSDSPIRLYKSFSKKKTNREY